MTLAICYAIQSVNDRVWSFIPRLMLILPLCCCLSRTLRQGLRDLARGRKTDWGLGFNGNALSLLNSGHCSIMCWSRLQISTVWTHCSICRNSLRVSTYSQVVMLALYVLVLCSVPSDLLQSQMLVYLVPFWQEPGQVNEAGAFVPPQL